MKPKDHRKGTHAYQMIVWSLLCYLFQTKFELVHSLTGNESDDITYSPLCNAKTFTSE